MNDLFSVAPWVVLACLALAALLGAVLASFVGCAVARSLAGQSFLTGRSHCDSCGHVLGPFELVPVFSWLRQKGRCRWCGANIPARCPVTEGLTAAAFGAFVWRYGVSLQTLEYLIFTLILLAVALVDWDTGFIPDGLLLAGILDFVLLTLLRGEGAAALGRGLLAGAALAVPLLLIVLVMDRVLGRESMGGGDIKLFFTVGLFGSLRTDLLVLLLACLIGIGLAFVPQKTAHEGEPSGAIPFGPAISAAAVLSLLWGEPFVAAYLNLFV